MIAKFVTRSIQARVLVLFAFDGSRLASTQPLGDEVLG
jgi:hypothetical protein